MKKAFATLQSPDLHHGPAMFLLNGKQQSFIGAWEFGRPDGIKFASAPDFDPLGVEVEAHLRADTTHANGLLLTHPVRIYEAFTMARSCIIEIEREGKRLYDKGYNLGASGDTLRRDVDKMIKELLPHCRNITAAKQACDEQELWGRDNFPASTENEVQEAMFDAAIVARLGELTVPEVRMLNEGVLPNRINDTRVIHALHRVPPAAHGINAEMLDKIRALYSRVLAPKTTAAVEYIRPMITAATTVIASAAVVFARRSSQTPKAIFAALPDGDFFAKRTSWAGYDSLQLADIIRNAKA